MSLLVRYRVSIFCAHAHLYEVEVEFPPAGEELVVCLPVWTPGSYLVREYARHVQQFEVFDSNNCPVPFKRKDKRSFVVTAKRRAIRCRYKVYANELTVRTSHLDSTHGYFNGATLFFYSEVFRDAEHRVTVEVPAHFRVSSPLGMDAQEYVARNYDELIDSPFEVGTHTPISFNAAGIPHEIALWGDAPLSEAKLVGDLTALIETAAAMFGGLPMKRYVFFIYASDKGRGGLEHKASSSLLYPRNGLSSAKGWEDFLTLCAHEYFHLWNIKRIKPKSFVRLDYSKENYTELLWWFEGATSYFDSLITRRAALMTAGRYLLKLGESLTALHVTPGRQVLSLVDASFLAWTKHYRADENTPNSATSYYLKGELVCALCDLLIRQATQDERSLDDVVRFLWQRYGDESGVPEDGVEKAAREVAQIDLQPFFDRSLRSVDELDYTPFSHVGLEVRYRQRESLNDKGGTPQRAQCDPKAGYVGLSTRGMGTIATVFNDSPAMHAGVHANDEVVALDGIKCDAAQLLLRCGNKRAGDAVKLLVFRCDRLVEIPIILGACPRNILWLARVENPSAKQKTSYEAWLGAPWDDDASCVERGES